MILNVPSVQKAWRNRY